MSPLALTLTLRLAAGALGSAALFVFARTIAATGEYPGRERIARYEGYLDRILRLVFSRTKARTIVKAQAAVALLGLLALLATGDPASVLIVVVAAGAPALYLAAERVKRRDAFDAQADAFILALANSLKAMPNIGGAIQGVIPVLQDPVRQEMGVVLSELRLGSTVEQALLNAAARAESAPFDAAVSALLVGRQVGGNLPKILETTAASIREMNRLEGVLRSKTSESKAQLWVLALFPIGIAFAFRMIKPDYFDPLRDTDVGHVVAGVAVVLWLAALMLARKLSQVDL